MKDKSFTDELVTRFKKNIYGSRKGEIRFAILWDYLIKNMLPPSGTNPMQILDAGCGLGQIASRLLEQGHHVTLCDSSSEMLEQASIGLPVQVRDRARWIHAPIQELPDRVEHPYDLLLCHAVLEWMSDPAPAVASLARLAKAGTRLSLMFYNGDALVFRNLIRGNWRKVQSGKLGGEPGGLTPINPLKLSDVVSWLQEYDFEIQDSLGLRTFFDYLPKSLQQERELADILELEAQLSRISPYREMARYIHIDAVKR
ncbi:MAG: methyltransferase domain-containing protein [Gammaproteobacteria bacterium]|nr:methyltransferase domain-containing protein [Gammaproteobacteria bacterium]